MQAVAGWQDNIYFVLVEPKEAGNIGASARAIKNMGFRNLCLVNPPAEMTDEGRWFAHNARDVLDAAAVYGSVAEAIKDKPIVVGTTRRRGKKRGLSMPAGEGVLRLYKMAACNKVAILFGREARGLFNEEVEECGLMLAIPSSPLQPSLNLSHAVMIIAYELHLSGYRKPVESDSQGPYVVSPDPTKAPALLGHGEIEGIYDRISGVLELLDYIPRGGRNMREKIMTNLRHFIGRAGLTQKELKMLHGLCHQVEKKMNGKFRGGEGGRQAT